MAAECFVPDEFEVPQALVTPLFRLEPLGPEHNERDYAAWTSSIEHIRVTPGFARGWPHAMSLDENRGALSLLLRLPHSRPFPARLVR